MCVLIYIERSRILEFAKKFEQTEWPRACCFPRVYRARHDLSSQICRFFCTRFLASVFFQSFFFSIQSYVRKKVYIYGSFNRMRINGTWPCSSGLSNFRFDRFFSISAIIRLNYLSALNAGRSDNYWYTSRYSWLEGAEANSKNTITCCRFFGFVFFPPAVGGDSFPVMNFSSCRSILKLREWRATSGAAANPFDSREPQFCWRVICSQLVSD